MVAQNTHANTTISGTVDRVKGNGFTLQGQAGWYNISKYATGVVMPGEGDDVLIHLDKAGYVRAVEFDADQLDPDYRAPKPAGRTFTERLAGTSPPSPVPASAAQDAPAPRSAGREAIITRLSCLKTAVELLTAGGDVADPALVLSVAAELEAWANRPE